MRLTTLSVLLAGCLAASPAHAQSAAPNGGAPVTDVGKTGGSTSDKLSDSNGVIRPSGDVDPTMNKPVPSTGSMPVIEPPGSPGGPSGVQPK